MYFRTLDGKEVWKMDSCSCCQMNTMGEHEWNCPLNDKLAKGYKIMTVENNLLVEKSLPIALPPYDYSISLCPSSWELFPKTMKD